MILKLLTYNKIMTQVYYISASLAISIFRSTFSKLSFFSLMYTRFFTGLRNAAFALSYTKTMFTRGR